METEAGNSRKQDANTTPTEQKILALAQASPKGISDKDLAKQMPDVIPKERADGINKLLSVGFLELFKEDGYLLYRLKDPSKAKITKGLDKEEKIVYTKIEKAGNKGIWIRDIRDQSKLLQTELNKILKNLEAKKFIKAVKSVTASKKKVYMLYNLEPDTSVTGGSFYEDQVFEADFVDLLNQQCYKYLEKKKEQAEDCTGGPIMARNLTFASLEEVWKFISDLGISKVKLSTLDIEMILNTLVYDGKVERTVSADKSILYRAVEPLLKPSGLMKSVCGVCPVRKNCCDVGDITPKKCQYLMEWLA